MGAWETYGFLKEKAEAASSLSASLNLDFETSRSDAFDIHYRSVHLAANHLRQQMRSNRAALAPVMKATKDRYILFQIDGDAYHVSVLPVPPRFHNQR